MRIAPILTALIVMGNWHCGDSSLDAAEDLNRAIAKARFELAAAKADYQRVALIEFPSSQRQVESELRLASEAIRQIDSQLLTVRRSNRYRYGLQRLSLRQDLEFALLAARLEYQNLQLERQSLRRELSYRTQPLLQRVSAARAQLVELEKVRLSIPVDE